MVLVLLGAASGEHEKAEGEVLFLGGGGGGGSVIGGDGGGGGGLVMARALGTLLLDPVIERVKRGVLELERGVWGGG